MTTTVNQFESRLADRLRAEREARGWSLNDLAERSGVSKAMISKIERAEVNPTAVLLGYLSGAFGVTLSSLLARVEGPTSRILRRTEQNLWQDPETGFRRTTLSPPGPNVLELIHCELPPGKSIAYAAAAFTFINQQILMLLGTLRFTEGADVYELQTGDCLQLGAPADCRFENHQRSSCRYLIAIAKRA